MTDDKPCATCKHGSVWRGYPPSFMVCNHPAALSILGGPHSCYDIVRKERGPCGPDAAKWEKKA